MDKSAILKKVYDACNSLLDCNNDFFIMKQSVDILYEIFSDLSSVDIHKLNDGEIALASGKAISPSAAAHCLLEMKRTAIFLRGIIKAIRNKPKNNSGPIHILYAGCGPYATLITPLLTLDELKNCKLTLLDINPISLKAVEQLFTKLGLTNFVNNYILADAALFEIDRDYDIIISETMQACLQNEPQVAIMKNLIPQMKCEAVFIPQQITISAYLSKPGVWNESTLLHDRNKTKFVKELFSVNRHKLEIAEMNGTISLPENLDGYIDLILYTFVHVFEDEILGPDDCSLNMPMKFYEFTKRYANDIQFWYRDDARPGIECKILNFA